MNELRMYVERLFMGRTLTEENIELKEEIYSNLVARYEDYVSGGMDADEALELTKSSITSIDEFVDESANEASQAEQPTQPTGDIPAQPDQATQAFAGADATATDSPEPVASNPAAAVAGTFDSNAAQAGKKRPNWPVIIGIAAAAVVVVVVCCVFAFGVVGLGHNRNVAATTGSSTGSTTTQDGSSDTGSSNVSTHSNSSRVWADPEDALEYEATMALVEEVEAHSVSAIQPYANVSISDSVSLKALVAALPMSEYVSSVSVDANTSNITVEYTNVDDNIDGDAIDYALVYDAVAIMSACSDLSSVTFTVQEAYDDPHDLDIYVYSRTMLNTMLNNYGSGDMSTDMIGSEDSWQTVRETILAYKFIDDASDYAERD